ncbi:neurogenic locus notch homolog protein 1-like [Mytilus californianus]|uniref:neurogenic locus notch homolog protein 1-like n=1 Tax=Mytilus californianus TaxID=6549 RepID=UPI002245F22C|nr:neurogenic locus notch homolog protein 1-like [Mytilus californianus]
MCYGKETCELTAKTSIFGDQCPKTSKYLQIDYQCEAIPRNLVICEGYKHSLRCPHQQIEIVSAYFGRSNTVTCSDGHNQSISCSAKGAKRDLEGVCQGKESCDVTADANIFGDPCAGTSKYLSIDYKCTDDRNSCTASRCQHGGTCLNHGKSSTCACTTGFTGSFCQTDINECELSPCMHGGRCIDGIGSYSCTCIPGFTGVRCEKDDTNPCTASRCQHGGSCINHGTSSTCSCTTGFTGSFCQTEINECEFNPCMHGGRCIDGIGSYRCMCKAGFTGVRCEKDVNDCECSPCMNGGTCIDGIDSYSCRCKADFTGVRCEKGIPGIGLGISNNDVNAIKDLRKEFDKGGKRVTLCQGSKKTFGCPNSTRILITDAKYGRTTTYACPDTPRKASSCETDISKEMANICDNQPTCNGRVFQQQLSAAANNPCLGTVPYVTLTYVCK